MFFECNIICQVPKQFAKCDWHFNFFRVGVGVWDVEKLKAEEL